MSEKKALFVINILRNIVSVYFDTFFVFYFFGVANYEVLPLAKYYITLYLFIGIGFFIIRKPMKKNIKVPYFRIGISLQALYIALIMLLKENIIHYIFLVGIIKGFAEGFYYYPKNIIDTEKVTNEGRQKFSGIVEIINKIVSIVIPLCLGVLLTFFSYASLGKIFFVIFIIMFFVSFYLKDENINHKKLEFKKFFRLVRENQNVRYSLLNPILSGLTYSSGVMGVIVTLSKIYNFKTNLNLGVVDSICAGLSLLVCVLFTLKIKPKSFNKVMMISGILSFMTILLFAFYPNRNILILYLFIRNSCVTIISLITSNVVVNLSNSKELNEELKPEYYCVLDILYAISRCFGYLLLLLVCLMFGMEYINYILILPALAILLEAIYIGKLSARN